MFEMYIYIYLIIYIYIYIYHINIHIIHAYIIYPIWSHMCTYIYIYKWVNHGPMVGKIACHSWIRLQCDFSAWTDATALGSPPPKVWLGLVEPFATRHWSVRSTRHPHTCWEAGKGPVCEAWKTLNQKNTPIPSCEIKGWWIIHMYIYII